MTRLMLFFNSVILLCIAWGANADGPLTDVKLQELLKKRNFPFNEALVDDNGMVYINASGKKVKDLQALEDISVQFLVLSHTEVESLDSLSSVRSLTQVDLSSTKVIDIEGLKNTQLEKLTLANTRVYNLSALTNCPLQYLNISGTKVSDLEPLRKLPLYSLNICNCTAITNLAPHENLWVYSGGIGRSPKA